MDSSFDANEPDDDLSTAFGTETLAERDMIPEGFANTPSSRSEMPVDVIGGGRYLRVDQSANIRAGSVISKIWNHGFEYRSLDHGLCDKHWRCKYCRPNKLFKVTGAGDTNTNPATPKEISSLRAFNPIEWWDSNQSVYGTLCLWAFDTLSIPAMATECERTFSSAKKLITPERNALSDDTIEASECLKAWWDQGLITQD
jgi:hypothetical protein